MERVSSTTLLRQLASVARQLGTRRVSLATSHACVRALVAAGATLCTIVIRYLGTYKTVELTNADKF